MWLSRVVAHTDCECLTLERARFEELLVEMQRDEHRKRANTFSKAVSKVVSIQRAERLELQKFNEQKVAQSMKRGARSSAAEPPTDQIASATATSMTSAEEGIPKQRP